MNIHLWRNTSQHIFLIVLWVKAAVKRFIMSKCFYYLDCSGIIKHKFSNVDGKMFIYRSVGAVLNGKC